MERGDKSQMETGVGALIVQHDKLFFVVSVRLFRKVYEINQSSKAGSVYLLRTLNTN